MAEALAREEGVHGLSNAQISRAIGLSRIVLIVGLVFLHYGSFPNSSVPPAMGLNIESHPFATWLNSALLFFFYSAVPLLSMISGWLFFSFQDEDAKASLTKRITRRFFSLYMPLVVWNIAYFAAMYGLFVLKPDAANFGKLNIDFTTAGALNYINAIFGITSPPIAFQFWFVRDLFMTVVVSPILWFMLKRAPWLGAAVFCVAWLSGFTFGIFFRVDVPFFFYLGGIVRRQKLSVLVPLYATCLLVALYVTLAGLRALAPYLVVFDPEDPPKWLHWSVCLMRLVGVIGCWGVIYRLAQTPLGGRLARFGGLAFFLHSAHWPLLSVLKSIMWKFVPAETDAWMLIHYVACVSATIVICLTAGFGLVRFAPRLFALMNGGRLLEQNLNKAGTAPIEKEAP